MNLKSLPFVKSQLLILFVFSLLVSAASIIHGVYFDLDIEQVKRLTIEGLILTLLVLFPAILFLQWVFDINNRKRFDELERKIMRKKRK